MKSSNRLLDVGKAKLDWPNLGFVYRQTNSFVISEYKEGAWGKPQSRSDPLVPVHIGSTALHYGQAAFEGLKAFQCQDGKIRIFRPELNAKRINKACHRICMPEIPESLFLEAINRAIEENVEYMPPYGTGGALYIRPVVFGSGARIGLQPADHYTFAVLVLPVSDYYRAGWTPVPAVIVEDFDRAAPRGVGNVKVAGNYAADILPNISAKKKGFPIALYLDSKTNTHIEEFSTSNFIAFTENNEYVTPKSDAILESITNLSLMDLALDESYDVQRRPIHVDEIFNNRFTEIGACGTAVVVTPIDHVYYHNRMIQLSPVDERPENSKLYSMYKRIRRIQCGEEEDKFRWLTDLQL
eukprot:gene7423-8006_t